MSQQNITPEELVHIINNIDKKYQCGGKDYLLIIKDQSHKPCSILISDCQEAVWTKTVDLSFFANLKRELQLASPLKIFAAHLVNSLATNSYIQRQRNTVKIFIQLQIGEGLIMSCSFKIENRVHYNNPDQFKKSLKKFLLSLWEVKNCQMKKHQQKGILEKLEKEKKCSEEQQEERKLRITNSKKIVPGKNYLIKKGDLMNPQRKKRKKLGAKLGTGHEYDMFVHQNNPESLVNLQDLQ